MSLIKESSKKISQFFSVRIKSIFPSFFQEENVSPSDSIVFKDHIDPTKTREEKGEMLN